MMLSVENICRVYTYVVAIKRTTLFDYPHFYTLQLIHIIFRKRQCCFVLNILIYSVCIFINFITQSGVNWRKIATQFFAYDK